MVSHTNNLLYALYSTSLNVCTFCLYFPSFMVIAYYSSLYLSHCIFKMEKQNVDYQLKYLYAFKLTKGATKTSVKWVSSLCSCSDKCLFCVCALKKLLATFVMGYRKNCCSVKV